MKRCAKRLGAVSPETRFRLTKGTSLVPDVSYAAYDRLRGLPESDVQEPPFSPDVAVEVRSPSDRDALIAEKTRLYLSYGAILVLNVDPWSRTLTAHTSSGDAHHFRTGEHFGCVAVPWLEFKVDELSADLDILK